MENEYSTDAPRVLLVGDIGQHTYHVGDEAMTAASAQFLYEGGCSLTLMTRDTEHSAQYLNAPEGGEYSYLPFLLFPWAPAERELMLTACERVLRELYPPALKPSVGSLAENIKSVDKPNTSRAALLRTLCETPEVQALPAFLYPLQETVATLIDWAHAVAGMDSVLISGGGNLNSRFGWLLYERAAVAMVAEYADVPLYVTGQSLGPVLTKQDAWVLERMLRSARSVTVREHTSLAWCRERGIEARLCVDDAVSASPTTPERTLEYSTENAKPPADIKSALPEHFVCVTINNCTQDQAVQLTHLLDNVHREHGLVPVFLSHYGDPQHSGTLGSRGDVEVHERIAEHLAPQTRREAVILPILHVDQSLIVHRAAALTITSRYHPAVFSAAAGIPVLALVPDAFTQMRVGGTLELYGWSEFTLPMGMLVGGVPELMVAAALRCSDADTGERREKLMRTLENERSVILARIQGPAIDSTDSCISILSGGPALPVIPSPLEDVPQVPALPEPLASTVRAARELFASTSLTAGFEWAMSDRAHSWDAEHYARLQGTRNELLKVREELQQLREKRTKRGGFFGLLGR